MAEDEGDIGINDIEESEEFEEAEKKMREFEEQYKHKNARRPETAHKGKTGERPSDTNKPSVPMSAASGNAKLLGSSTSPIGSLITDLNEDILKTISKKGNSLMPLTEPTKTRHKKPATAKPSKRRIFVDATRPVTTTKAQRAPWSATTRVTKIRKDYLQVAKEKEAKELDELNNILENGRRRKEVEYIAKVQEATDLAKRLNKGYTFATAGGLDRGLRIYQINELGEKLQITHEDFIREYKRIKREHLGSITFFKNSTMKSMMWTEQKSQAITGMKETKSDRQKKIQEVLDQTKQMTDTLEKYLKALDQKGIYGEMKHNKK